MTFWYKPDAQFDVEFFFWCTSDPNATPSPTCGESDDSNGTSTAVASTDVTKAPADRSTAFSTIKVYEVEFAANRSAGREIATVFRY